MKVLVLETESGVADEAIGNLESAGHDVYRCHDASSRPFPCVALEHQGCPLQREAIDVALSVRAVSGTDPTPLEDGVACALRSRVPLVVAGASERHPYERWHGVAVHGSDVVGACEATAAAADRELSEAATSAFQRVLARAGCPDQGASATVVHRAGGLQALLEPPGELDRRMAGEVSMRLAAVLRALDRTARTIDVRVAGSRRASA